VIAWELTQAITLDSKGWLVTSLSSAPEAEHTRLSTRWRGPARLAWWVTVVLLLWGSATEAWRALVTSQVTSHLVIWQILMPLGFLAIGLAIFWRRSDDWLGLLTSFTLIAEGVFVLSGASNALMLLPGWRLAASFLQGLATSSFVLLVFVFPDGHFAPAAARPLGLAALALPVITVLFALAGWPNTAVVPLFSAWVILGLSLQVYRYQRVSGPVQRQQTKWVVAGLASPVLVTLMYFILISPRQSALEASSVYTPLLGLASLMALVLPLSIAISILRYRLWDIDILVNRALVYGLLTLLLALGYFGTVVILQAVFQAIAGQTSSGLVTVVSTLLIAAIAAPLRRRLQNVIDHRFYRHRYDTTRTLAEFGASLRDNVDLDQLSERLLVVVDNTMQPVDVSLWIKPRSH